MLVCGYDVPQSAQSQSVCVHVQSEEGFITEYFHHLVRLPQHFLVLTPSSGQDKGKQELVLNVKRFKIKLNKISLHSLRKCGRNPQKLFYNKPKLVLGTPWQTKTVRDTIKPVLQIDVWNAYSAYRDMVLPGDPKDTLLYLFWTITSTTIWHMDIKSLTHHHISSCFCSSYYHLMMWRKDYQM